MSASLLILHWPDLAPDGTPPALLAHGVQRHLRRRFRHSAAAVFAAGENEPLFARWGLRPLPLSCGAEKLFGLLPETPESLILAMAASRAAELLEASPGRASRAEIWTPTGDRPAPLPQGARQAVLRDVLSLGTLAPAGLFVDARVLETRALPAALRRVRELIPIAELAGAIVTARLYGLGEEGPLELAGLEEPAGNGKSAGTHGGAEQLRTDLESLLADPHAPGTWIVAAEGAWLGDLVERAHRRGIRVLSWSAAGEAVPAEVAAAADGCAELPALLQAARALAGGMGAGIRPAPVDLRPPEADAPARLGPWARLIYHTECCLRRARTGRIPLRRLSCSLAELEEFGPTPANALMWLNRARDEGMLLTEPGGESGPGWCRPSPVHPVSRAAVEVPDRCIRLLRQMLQRMPWVSFKLLRGVLARDQWLGGPPFHLDDAAVDEWLNFLIHDGAIAMTKEPNIANPEFPVTALRQNEDHPFGRSPCSFPAEGSSHLTTEHAILVIDHFLIRNRKPWMAMTTLRRTLDRLGRDELQSVLQGLQNLGAVATASYPNPQKQHLTTGCHLNPEAPIVRAALARRDAIIRTAQGLHRCRGWIPLLRLDEELDGQPGLPAAPEERLAWLLLLREEGILELDPPGLRPDETARLRCRLNLTDPVVRAVVAESTGAGIA